MIITILAYKTDGVTTRRCCVVDSWSSDFEYFVTPSVEDATEWLGKKKYENHKSAQGSYEFTILIDGVDDNYWHDDETEETREARDDVRYRIENDSELILNNAVTEEKAQLARKEAARVASLAAAEKARKVAEFENLKVRLNSIEADKARLRELEMELEQ